MDKEIKRAALKEAIYQRRSTRAYTAELVPDDLLEEILNAGRYAPSATNQQKTHFFVITNPEKLAELREIMTRVIANTPEKEGMSPVFLSMIQRAKQGSFDVSYGTPTLIVTTNIKGSLNSLADCSCALQNMMLTASALGLANCWINQFFTFRDAPPVADFFAGIGVADDEEICGALALGYSENIETEPLPRTGNPVTYVR